MSRFRRVSALARACSVLFLTAAAVLELAGPAAARSTNDGTRSAPWAPEIVKLWSEIPVQDRGRVKPLESVARVTMLQLRHRQSIEVERGGKKVELSAMEWFLDALFYPHLVEHDPLFRIENSEVLDAIELPHDGKRKRDYYSFEELTPGLAKLQQVAGRLHGLEDSQQTGLEKQIMGLYGSLISFRRLTLFLEFARQPLSLGSGEAVSDELSTLFPTQPIPVSAIVARWTELREKADAMRNDPAKKADGERLGMLLRRAEQLIVQSSRLSMFPPKSAEDKAWMAPSDVADFYLGGIGGRVEPQLAFVQTLEKIVADPANVAVHKANLETLHGEIRGLAKQRGEFGTLDLEVDYHHKDWFYNSIKVFILAFVLVAVSLLVPKSKPLHIAAFSANVVAWGLLVIGIVYRCIIVGRPPVTTLYETCLFVTAVAVPGALILDLIHRQRVGGAIASVLGIAGGFLAHQRMVAHGDDTLRPLVAVLDTNFWLATHVTAITTGYASGLLAAAIAHVYVFGKAFKLKADDPEFYRRVGRMVYGVLCFSLLFSIVGTILGGVWANDSWGRFWGWDPKENGALMICLWQLAVLHLRLGGYIKWLGVCLGAIFGGIVVTFSWWGVNNFEVGLHSYGPAKGIWDALYTFWGIEGLPLGLGAWLYFKARAQSTPRKSATEADPSSTSADATA